MDQQVKAKAAGIKLLLLDVDGVLTDGTVYVGPEGEALKAFNVRDGTGIKWLQRAGLEVGLLTGRQSSQVAVRARELKIEIVVQDAKQKLPAFRDILSGHGLAAEEVAFMGDDLLDLPVLRRAGLALAPADAEDRVKEEVDWISAKCGGQGAVREACELILKATGKWEEITGRYEE
ncbi:MAG: HAD-IIIA family hydrolase [bacterium]